MQHLKRLSESLKYKISVFFWNVRRLVWEKQCPKGVTRTSREKAIRALQDPYPPSPYKITGYLIS